MTKLLSGGNPQIAKADGDAPVKAWIAAAPGFRGEVARRLDGLIVAAVPGVVKAVKWNSPFYGVRDRGWFLSFHAFDKYLKVLFFNGVALDPPPPVGSKQKTVRYLHVGPEGLADEARFVDWVRQASAIDGERL